MKLSKNGNRYEISLTEREYAGLWEFAYTTVPYVDGDVLRDSVDPRSLAVGRGVALKIENAPIATFKTSGKGQGDD